jgi:hypothetical protein
VRNSEDPPTNNLVVTVSPIVAQHVLDFMGCNQCEIVIPESA